MGLTQKLGTIPQSVFTDSSNNVGIGAAPSGSYKFDVTGTGRFTSTLLVSGAATFSSTLDTAGNITSTVGVANTSLKLIRTGNTFECVVQDTKSRIRTFGASGNDRDLLFDTDNAGTTRMTILAGGNVGIGTSNPTRQLFVNSTAFFDNNGDGSTTNPSIAIGSTSVGLSYIAGGNLALLTGGTERMRITSGGSVCINSTSPLDSSAKLNVSGNVYLGATASGAGNSTLKYNTGTGLVSFDTSARIFKKDIFNLEYGLESVLKMTPKKYKWKSNSTEDLGFIADEMYDIVPEVVYLADNKVNKTELKDGEPMGINYDRLVPVLVKAIQEQQTLIEELKADIEVLKAKL